MTLSRSASGILASDADPGTTINEFSFFCVGERPDGEEVFGIYLSDNDSFSSENAQDGLYGFMARNSGRPRSGQYPLVALGQGLDSGDFIGVLYEDFRSTNRDAPFTLRESSPDNVAGSLDFTAYEVTFNSTFGTVDSVLVDLSGSFTAENMDEFAPLQQPFT